MTRLYTETKKEIYVEEGGVERPVHENSLPSDARNWSQGLTIWDTSAPRPPFPSCTRRNDFELRSVEQTGADVDPDPSVYLTFNQLIITWIFLVP